MYDILITAAICLPVGIAIGTLKARKFKALAETAERRVETLEERAEGFGRRILGLRAEVEAADARVAELEPLAEIGRRTRAARDKQNEGRKAARAANRV